MKKCLGYLALINAIISFMQLNVRQFWKAEVKTDIKAISWAVAMHDLQAALISHVK